ncbi:MAG: acylneuraminate cytidylyltransferase family protein [Sulfitobacter sp.]
MIAGKRVLALIPARAGSKGLPDKNIRPLLGHPLLAWPVTTAQYLKHADRVILSTDSQSYADIGRAYGAEVPFLRPAELASDTTPSMDFILNLLDTLETQGDTFEYLVLLEPTSPMTTATDVDAALETLDAQRGQGMHSAIGISAMETQHPSFAVRLNDATGQISPHQGGSFDTLPRRQDLDPVYALDGSFYISTVDALRRTRSFCHDATIGIPTDRFQALEIDDLVDFLCVEAVMKYRAQTDPNRMPAIPVKESKE